MLPAGDVVVSDD